MFAEFAIGRRGRGDPAASIEGRRRTQRGPAVGLPGIGVITGS